MIQEITGRLVMETLFKGPKSEGVYPVVQAADGISYRVHVIDEGRNYGEILKQFDNSMVLLSGVTDCLRGHWRIVIHLEDLQICHRDRSELACPAVTGIVPPTDVTPVVSGNFSKDGSN